MPRDIIVVGASMGGIAALSQLVENLPPDLPASVFVVLHTSPDSPGMLAMILERRGQLPVRYAQGEAVFLPGHIYVARPDRHLVLQGSRMRLALGPRENRHRPAIDPLFRSASVAGRNRVIGVMLTGLLDDGTAGLLAVKQCGGVAVVQSPAEAAYPQMPQSALDRVDVDHEVPLREMGPLLDRLAREDPGEAPPVPSLLFRELKISERAMGIAPLGEDSEKEDSEGVEGMEGLGPIAPFTCPDCGGSLWVVEDQPVRRYRCHVGHTMTEVSLLAQQDTTVEGALLAAMRAMEERTRMLEIMARDERARADGARRPPRGAGPGIPALCGPPPHAAHRRGVGPAGSGLCEKAAGGAGRPVGRDFRPGDLPLPGVELPRAAEIPGRAAGPRYGGDRPRGDARDHGRTAARTSRAEAPTASAVYPSSGYAALFSRVPDPCPASRSAASRRPSGAPTPVRRPGAGARRGRARTAPAR